MRAPGSMCMCNVNVLSHAHTHTYAHTCTRIQITFVDALHLRAGEEVLQQLVQVRRCLHPRCRVGRHLLDHAHLCLQDVLHFGRHDCASFGRVAGQRPLVATWPRYRQKLQRVVPRVVARDDRVHRVVWPPAKERATAAQSGAPTRVARPAVIVEGNGALERLPLLEGNERHEPGLFSSLVQRLATQPLAPCPAEVGRILIERPHAQLLTAQLAATSPELHGVGDLSAEPALLVSGVCLWRSEVLRLVISHLGLPTDLLGLERLPLWVWSRRVLGRSRLGERHSVRLPIGVKSWKSWRARPWPSGKPSGRLGCCHHRGQAPFLTGCPSSVARPRPPNRGDSPIAWRNGLRSVPELELLCDLVRAVEVVRGRLNPGVVRAARVVDVAFVDHL
eukprot:scaffold40417_cov62-Phaeocystis_antarctica.AAC.1